MTDLSVLSSVGVDFVFDRFPYAVHTLYYRAVSPRITSHKHIVRTYTHSTKAQCVNDCIEYNKQGYDIFFMVNEGDGVTTGSGTTVRNTKAIINVHYCFLDLDGADLPTVLRYLSSIHVTPHFVVNTSPNRYHVYIQLEPISAESTKVFQWKLVQSALMRLGDPNAVPAALGLDKAMIDVSRVLRVPGFYHVEKQSLVTVVQSNTHSPYSLSYMLTATSAKDFEDVARKQAGALVDFNEPTVYGKGDRFDAARSAAMQIANNVSLSERQMLTLYKEFVTTSLDNTDPEFLTPQNKLTDRALEILNSAISKVKQEIKDAETKRLTAILDSIDAKKRSPWNLDKEFYLNAPNGFGEIVQIILNASMVPLAPVAFGSALAALSVIRSLKWRCPMGKSPALYVLNVSPSASGKSFPMQIIERTLLRHTDLGRMVFSNIASSEGLGRQLHSSGSVGLWNYNEAAAFFGEMQDTKANFLHKKILANILKLFNDCPEKLIWNAMVSDEKKNKNPIVLNYPAMGISAYMVPSDFDEVFSLKSIEKGLLGRFLIFKTEYADTPDSVNTNCVVDGVINHPLFLDVPTPMISAAELPIEATVPALINTEYSVRCPPRMTFTEEAEKYFHEMMNKYYLLCREYSKDKATEYLTPLYNRTGELTERVATTLSLGVIDLPTLQYSEKLVLSRVDGAVANIKERFGTGGLGKAASARNDIINKYMRLVDQQGGTSHVSKRKLCKRCTNVLDGDYTRISQMIDSMVKMGDFIKVDMSPDRTEYVALGDILQD